MNPARLDVKRMDATGRQGPVSRTYAVTLTNGGGQGVTYALAHLPAPTLSLRTAWCAGARVLARVAAQKQ
jgi:hypothetical protein